MKQYGDYARFDHEPSEGEIMKVIEQIFKELALHAGKNAAIIKKHDDGSWTVGIKVFL